MTRCSRSFAKYSRIRAAIRFEGNNYSEDWVKEAKKRGLPNLRRTPEALKELVSKQSRALLTKLGVLTKEELESRYHVRVERYVKDMLIELHTMREMVDTIVIPAAYGYLGHLSKAASQSKAAGVAVVPQITTANQVGELVQELQEFREDLSDVIARVEAKHEDPTGTGGDAHLGRSRHNGGSAKSVRRPGAVGGRRLLAAAEVQGDALPGLISDVERTVSCFTELTTTGFVRLGEPAPGR